MEDLLKNSFESIYLFSYSFILRAQDPGPGSKMVAGPGPDLAGPGSWAGPCRHFAPQATAQNMTTCTKYM